jgi:hypothetical protein
MAHRNAEIWAERHRRLEALKEERLRHFADAKRGAFDETQAELVSLSKAAYLARYHVIERRVWHALNVAKGWRRA